jgi:N-acetylglucosamine-6-phosphate deacetylase
MTLSQPDVFIYNAAIITPQITLQKGWIHLVNGLIHAIGTEQEYDIYLSKLEADTKKIDAHGSWVLPGFIDMHVHGGYGHDFMDADAEGLDAITRFHGMNGTTTMLATTVTAAKEELDHVLQRIGSYRNQIMPYAQLLGVHLEGPFINANWCGAQNPAFIVPPHPDWLSDWTQRFPGLIRMQTLAPETAGALEYIEALVEHGIIAALGHTDANYEQVNTAIEHGLSQAVHTYNAMRGLHHREPGAVGAIMSNPAILGEVIADGHHVHPTAIRLLVQAKGPEGVLLITDAMSAAGLGNGEYELGGLAVIVRDGVARLKEGNSLAGSTLTMIDAFRFVVQQVGVSVEDASLMASCNQARQLGIDQITGSLQPGLQADVLLVNSELELERVWIGGRSIQ